MPSSRHTFESFVGRMFRTERATPTVQTKGRSGRSRPYVPQQARSTPRSNGALCAARKRTLVTGGQIPPDGGEGRGVPYVVPAEAVDVRESEFPGGRPDQTALQVDAAVLPDERHPNGTGAVAGKGCGLEVDRGKPEAVPSVRHGIVVPDEAVHMTSDTSRMILYGFVGTRTGPGGQGAPAKFPVVRAGRMRRPFPGKIEITVPGKHYE